MTTGYTDSIAGRMEQSQSHAHGQGTVNNKKNHNNHVINNDHVTIASLRAKLEEKEEEIEQYRKGIKSNLKSLDKLEAIYKEELDQLHAKLVAETKQKNEFAQRLASVEQQLQEMTDKVTTLEQALPPDYKQHQPFWEFHQEMQSIVQLFTNKIDIAKTQLPEQQVLQEKLVPREIQDDISRGTSSIVEGFSSSDEEDSQGEAADKSGPLTWNPETYATRRATIVSGMNKLKRGVKRIGFVHSMASKQKFINWSQALRRADPRHQILTFFDQIAKKGADALEDHCEIGTTGHCTHRCLDEAKFSRRSIVQFNNVFNKAGIFTVWRPTSLDSIRRMMIGEGVGKGLDIKGKSAKQGHLSAFVPFLQLHKESHKKMCRTIPILSTVRVFYQTSEARDHANKTFLQVAQEMADGYKQATETIKRLKIQEARGMIKDVAAADAQREEAFGKYMWELDPKCSTPTFIHDYVPKAYGLEVPQRVFFEAYVMRGDCSREPGSIHDTGRRSEPAFQDMNMETLRTHKPDSPRPVLVLYTKDPNLTLDPRYLLMAYEENGTVNPVVSDFDCFLVGTRRINFEKKMPDDQVALMKWCIAQIEKILAIPPSSETWTMHWLENLKQEYQNGFHVTLPKYGFADPKSYMIMAHAVDDLSRHGSVRHGAECFNYYFPQDLDDEFLVVTNNQPNGPWVKYTKTGLLDFLSKKVDEGFMFPLNPKWVLCDPGWKMLWDKQMATDNETAKGALDSWYPPESGVREMIERIHAQYPNAFQVTEDEPYQMTKATYSPLRIAKQKGEEVSGDCAMDMALLEVAHDRLLRKALNAFKVIIFANRLYRSKSVRQLTVQLDESERTA